MNVIGRGGLSPLSTSVGFLEAPAVDVASAWVSWWGRQEDGRATVDRHDLNGGLASALANLDPLTAPSSKVLVVPTVEDRWTAWFHNTVGGTDPLSGAGYLSGVLGTRAVAIDDNDGWVQQFSLFDQGDSVRTVSASAQTGRRGWQFTEGGPRLPWENPEAFDRRRVRDRFGPAELEAICAGLGIQLRDDDWFAPGGRTTLVHRHGGVPVSLEVSFAEFEAR